MLPFLPCHSHHTAALAHKNRGGKRGAWQLPNDSRIMPLPVSCPKNTARILTTQGFTLRKTGTFH